MCAELVDGAALATCTAQGTIGEHGRTQLAVTVEVEELTGQQQAMFEQRAEAHAWRVAPNVQPPKNFIVASERLHSGNTRGGGLNVAQVLLDADITTVEATCDCAGGAGAKKRIEHDVAGVGASEENTVEQGLGLLGGVQLFAVLAQAFSTSAERH
ncbi:hypothetical protein HC891_25175, partial [Candidatus Gracilibacteria bacterium]|nr:hypothetical protein [Candidatus Gracilibacteria bacterium]